MSTSHGTRLRGRTWYRRVVLGILAVVMLVGGLFGPTGASGVAHAATVLPYNDNGHLENPPLKFLNGTSSPSIFVQHNPTIYPIFWGNAWNSDTATMNTIVNTLKALAGSPYNQVLTQYTDGSGPDGSIHNDVRVMTPVVDNNSPPANIDLGFETDFGVWNNAQGRHEADSEIAAKHWPVNQDAQVMIFPQKGTTYDHGSGWCGVHSYNSTAPSHYAYAFIQYGDQQTSCNQVGDSADEIAWTAVHEYAEMATDPQIRANPKLAAPNFQAYGGGWQTDQSVINNSSNTPEEVADLCEGYSPTGNNATFPDYTDNTGIQYDLPYLWSNADNGCVASVFPPGPQLYALSPDRQGVYALDLADAAGLTRGPVSWTQVGGPAAHIYAGAWEPLNVPPSTRLAATDPQTGNINLYNSQNGNWSQIGGPGTNFVYGGDGLYGQSAAGVFQYSGQGMNWSQIGGPAGQIYPGSFPFEVLATDIHTGNIYGYQGGVWQQFGGPGLNFVANNRSADEGIFGQSTTGIFQYTGQGTNWTQVGGPAGQIYAGGNFYSVLATDIHTGDLYGYHAGNWQQLSSGMSFLNVVDVGTVIGDLSTSTTDVIVGLTSTGVFLYLGGTSWEQVGGPAAEIAAVAYVVCLCGAG